MNCKKCGAILNSGDQFCKNCGAPIESVSNAMGDINPTTINPTVINPSNSVNSETSLNNNNMFSNNTNTSNSNPVDNIGVSSEIPVNNNPFKDTSMSGSMSINEQPSVKTDVQTSIPVSNIMNQNNMNMNTNPTNVNPTMEMFNTPNTNVESPKKNKPSIKKTIISTIIYVAIFTLINSVGIAIYDHFRNSNANDSSISAAKDTYSVYYKNFKFNIPSDLVYKAEEDSIILADEAGTWNAYIEVLEGSYDVALSNKDVLRSNYEQQGYKVTKVAENKIGKKQFLNYEISAQGTNCLVGITKANSMYIFGVSLYTQNNDFDYETMKKLAPILENTSYSADSNKIENQRIDLTPFANNGAAVTPVE